MSLSATLPATIVETMVAHLATLFLAGANGDESLARHAAARMLAGHDPQTEAELRLAAQIISFGCHALEALSQAAHPGMPLSKILRLRGSAVSLSRESDKAQRRLDRMQKTRREAPQQVADPEPVTTPEKADKAIALVAATRQDIQAGAFPKLTQADRKRHLAQQITRNLRNAQAGHHAQTSPA